MIERKKFLFRKNERIHLQKEIEKIFKFGLRIQGSLFALIWVEQSKIVPQSLGYSRFAVLFPRGYANAVARNRIKRILREIFRHEKENIQPSMDLLIKLRREEDSVSCVNPSLFKKEFIALCMKAGIYNVKT